MIVQNNRAKIYVAKSQRVYFPGNTIVADNEIEAPDVADLIKAGVFTVTKTQAPAEKAVGMDENESEAMAIKRMDVDPAVETISNLLNIKTLRELMKLDDRMEIQEAVETKVKELTDHREQEAQIDVE